MSEKEIVKVFVWVQELEYYDRIMLLVGAKFAEIVKVGETIEDGLRTGKIGHVAASLGSSGLLKKKREDVSSISYVSEGKKPSRKFSSYQGRSRTLQSSHPACFVQADYQTPLQLPNYPFPSYQNTPPSVYQNTLPVYQNPPSIYQIPPSHYCNAALNCGNVQSNYQTLPHMYQTPPPHYQNNPSTYQITQLILIPDTKLLVQTPKIIVKCVLPNKATTIPVQDLRKN
uniref:Uncharacterized protein n=1 Tax=Solanum tuberosum TaxID=4113 RepID=M0ZH70_SOLTU